MTVEPGFGGQDFIPSGLDKIKRLSRILARRRLDRVLIAVDGGINTETAGEVIKAGATVLVAGSAIFNNRATVAENVQQMQSAIENGRRRKGSWRKNLPLKFFPIAKN